MRYLITSQFFEPFYSQWFEPNNHFNPYVDMVVYDLLEQKYTTDGVTWLEIKKDHL